MRYQVRLHPTLDVLVSSVGEVLVPATKYSKAHWTFGSKYKQGYMYVQVNGKRYRVHRLVAGAFLGDIPSGYETDHIDRDRSNNAVTNIRIVSRSGNCRNTCANDRVDSRSGTHWYENEKQYQRERYLTHYQSFRERDAKLRKTHKNVRFSDGSQHWIPNSEALELLKLPVKERTWPI